LATWLTAALSANQRFGTLANPSLGVRGSGGPSDARARLTLGDPVDASSLLVAALAAWLTGYLR
jgi:hypothetical protein